MGVFSFVDDGSVPGYAVLKLSDGRKRSMSLWVRCSKHNFVVALYSGRIHHRQWLLICTKNTLALSNSRLAGVFEDSHRSYSYQLQAIEKSPHRGDVKLVPDTSEVKLRIKDQYVVTIVCAFRCMSIWPRSASQWPSEAVRLHYLRAQFASTEQQILARSTDGGRCEDRGLRSFFS